MKLMIAIPVLDYIHFDFTRCLTGLTKRLAYDHVDFDVCFKCGTVCHHARDVLAREAVNNGYTHILWLDADMIFNDDLFYRLLETGKDFVTGVYHTRHAPYGSCIFLNVDPPEPIVKYPDELFKIAGCGFGCVLMKTEVALKVYQKFEKMFHPKENVGEDITFCQRAIECGYDVWCDPSIQAGHIGHLTIWPDMKK